MTHSAHSTTVPAGGLSPALRRTGAFVAAGIGLLVAGWLAQPRFTPRVELEERQGMLFPDLADAGKAASLEIVSYDDELATLAPFKVVQSGGVWVLPSHDNYPADAKDQLAAAATELVDRPILDVISTSPADHETYGVIEPDPEKVKVGMTGVGQLVEIRDAAGNRLARLVIGKESKRPSGDAGEGRSLRYVRRAGQDPVYLVEIDTSKFTTTFDDWIEKDLLKLSPWDVRRLTIDDSSATFGIDQATGQPTVSQDRRARIDLAYDDKEATWSLVKLEAFKGGKPRAETLAADQELASGRLNDLRNALGDLKIVDVARKPAGLSGDLKADKAFIEDREAVVSLAQRGFYPFSTDEILPANGETIVGMKDGVEYLLRFGNTTTVAGRADEDEARADAAPAETTGRYLFVSARFNEDLLEKPALDPLPDAPAADAQGPAAAKDGDGKATAPKADGAAGDLEKADEAEAKAQAALEERRRVERENRRKQDEYDGKVKAAQKRVRELNGRFADWYYVVSDAEYAKIHLDRAGVIQVKAADAAPPAPPQP